MAWHVFVDSGHHHLPDLPTSTKGRYRQLDNVAIWRQLLTVLHLLFDDNSGIFFFLFLHKNICFRIFWVHTVLKIKKKRMAVNGKISEELLRRSIWR